MENSGTARVRARPSVCLTSEGVIKQGENSVLLALAWMLMNLPSSSERDSGPAAKRRSQNVSRKATIELLYESR